MEEQDLITPQEFAKQVKAKYPQYESVEDSVLVEKMLEKYPQYKDKINFEVETPETPKGDTAEVSGESASTSADTTSSSDSEKSNSYRLPTQEEMDKAYDDSFVEIEGGVKIPKGNVLDLGKSRERSTQTIEDLTDDLDNKSELSQYKDRLELVGVDSNEAETLKLKNYYEDSGTKSNVDYTEMFKQSSDVAIANAKTSTELGEEDPYKNYEEYRDVSKFDIPVYNMFNPEKGELDGIENLEDFKNYLVKSGEARKFDREIVPHQNVGDYLNSEGDTQVQAYKHRILSDYYNEKRLKDLRDYEILKSRGIVNSEDNSEEMEELRNSSLNNTKKLLGQINKFTDLKQRYLNNELKNKEWEEYLRGDSIDISKELEYYGSTAWNSFSKILMGTVGSTLDLVGDLAGGKDDYNFLHSTADATDAVFDMVSVDMPQLQKVWLTYKPVSYGGKDYQVDVDSGNVYEGGILSDLDDAERKEITKLARGVKTTESDISGRATFGGSLDMITQLYMMVKTAKSLPIKNYTASAGFSGVLQTHHNTYTETKKQLEEAIRTGTIDAPIEDVEGLAKMNTYLNDMVVFSAGMMSPNKPLAKISDPKKLVSALYSKDATKTLSKKLQDYTSSVLKESIKEVGQEELELVASKNINHLTNLLVGENILDTKISKSEVAETALVTLLGTGLSTGVSERSKLSSNKGMFDLYRNAVALSKLDSPSVNKAIDNAVSSGDITAEQGKAISKVVFNISKYDGKIPATITKDEVREELLPLLEEREKLEMQEKNSDKAFKDSFAEKQEEVSNRIKTIVRQSEIETEFIISDEKEALEEGLKLAEGNKHIEEIIREDLRQLEEDPIKYFERAAKEAKGEELSNSFSDRASKLRKLEELRELRELRDTTDNEVTEEVHRLGEVYDKAIEEEDRLGEAYDKAADDYTQVKEKFGFDSPEYDKAYENQEKAYKEYVEARNKRQEILGEIKDSLNNETNKQKTTGDTTVGTTENVEGREKNAETEGVPTEGKEEVSTEAESSIKDIEKINLSESLGINKAIDIIDSLDKKLKDFGDETLGVNLPVAVARVGLKAMKAAAQTSKLTADVVSAGVNAITETQWYRDLKQTEKNEFHKRGLMNILGDMETTLRKGSQPTTKANRDFRNKVKEVTGQTDTSKKLVTTEAKMLKEKLKNLSKGSKIGAKAIMQAKKDAIKAINEAVKPYRKDKELLGKAYSTAMSAVNQYNGTNWDKVEGAIDKLTQKLDEAKLKKDLKKSIKKAKSNAKKTSVAGQVIDSILRYDPSWITDEADLAQYKDILDKFNSGEGFVLPEAQEFFKKLEDKYLDSIPEKEVRSTRPANNDEKKALADNLAKLRRVDKSMLTSEEVNMVKEFLRIPLEYFNTLPDTKVRALNRALNRFNETGLIPAGIMYEYISDEAGYSTGKEMSQTLAGKILKVRGNAIDAIKSLISGKSKELTHDDIIAKINNRMLHHIDNVITNLKGYKLYSKVIHPITSKITKAENETSQVERTLINLLAKAKGSVEGSRVSRLKSSVAKGLKLSDAVRYETELSIKTQMYFRQKEYEANKSFSNATKGVAKVFSVAEHMKAMNNENLSTNYKNGEKDIDAVNKVYDEYKDSKGELDLQKLEDSFTKEEKALISYMESVIDDMSSKSSFLNTHVRGERLTMLGNYFPRRSAMRGSLDKDALDSSLSRLTDNTGLKDSSSNERQATKAEPLDFNTFNNFLRYVKGSNLEYNVAPELKKAISLKKYLAREGGSAKELGNIIEETLGNIIKAQKPTGYGKNTKVEKAFKVFQKNTFNKLLIDPFRFTVDFMTNQGITYLANAYRFGRIREATKSIDKNLMKTMAREHGSVQYERLAKFKAVLGDSSIDYKQTALGALSKSRYGTTAESLRNNSLELLQKNVLSDVGDVIAVRYYQAVDSVAAPLWVTEVYENFKKATGVKLSSENYEAMKDEYPKELKEAIAQADKETSNLFNTVATSEQKLNIQLRDSESITKMVDSFMKTFAFNENSTLWDSIISLGSMGKKGNMTVEQATRNFFILTTRSIAYSFMTQIMLDYAMQAFGIGEDDDDELEERALTRAIAQHGSLLTLGNYGNLVNMVANMVYVTGQEINAALNDEDFNKYEDSHLYSKSGRGSLSNMAKSLGAGGETFSTLILQPMEVIGGLSIKLAEEGELTEEDLVEAKVAGYSLNLFAQMTGLSTYRLGKIVDKQLKEGVD